MLRDATYTGATPAVLGLARRRRRAGRMGHARPDELRQGPARPARPRLARRRARTVSQRPGRRPLVRTAPDALELAERAGRAATGDEVEALVHAERSGFARFAALDACTSRRSSTTRRSRFASSGTAASGTVVTNRTDEDGLREAARRAEEAADHARPDPGFPGLAPPAPVPDADGWDEETAALTPEGLAERAWSAIAAPPEIGLYGYVTSGVTELAVASTTGQSRVPGDHRRDGARARGRRDGAPATRTRPRGGSATSTRPPSPDEPPRRRRGPATPAELEPGTYRAVLSPWAFGELLAYFSLSSLGALALLEGRSYLTGRLGRAGLRRAPDDQGRRLDPRGLPKAFDFEGVPKAPRHARRGGGRARRRVGPAQPARGRARESTGHALPGPAQSHGPAAVQPGRGRRRRDARRAGRAGGRRHLRDPAPLREHRRRPRVALHRHDARRNVPDRERPRDRAARQPPVHDLVRRARRRAPRSLARDDRS